MKIPNPNESESVARVVYPPLDANHNGSALHLFAKLVLVKTGKCQNILLRNYTIKLQAGAYCHTSLQILIKKGYHEIIRNKS